MTRMPGWIVAGLVFLAVVFFVTWMTFQREMRHTFVKRDDEGDGKPSELELGRLFPHIAESRDRAAETLREQRPAVEPYHRQIQPPRD